MDLHALIRILIYSCLTYGVLGSPSVPIPQCLTGYMTDVQSWVDHNGRLRGPANMTNSIDVSYQLYCTWELDFQMQKYPCTRNGPVLYLSMARCQLKQFPIIFKYIDSCGNFLSENIQFISVYGNYFEEKNFTTAQYSESMNATRAMIISEKPLRVKSEIGTWMSSLQGARLQSLREFDLRLCGIQELKDNVFSNMPNLEKLYLGENNIFVIGDSTFAGLNKLKHLDISRNYEYDKNGTFKGLNFYSWRVFENLNSLRSLDFSFTKMTQRKIPGFKSISRNLERLSICHTGLSNLNDDYLPGATLKYLDVSGNIHIFSNMTKLRGLERTLKVLYADEIALNSLDMFKDLTELEILRVSGNEINEIDRSFARNVKKLQILILDMNRLIAWFEPTIALMPRLKFLSIRENNINVISEEMVNDLKNVSYIGLSDNFIVCNCNAREMFELAIRNEFARGDEFITPISATESNETSLMYHRGFVDVNYAISIRKPLKPFGNNGTFAEIPLNVTGRYLIYDYDETGYHCLLVTEGKSKSFAKVPPCQTNREIDMDELMRSTWNKMYLLIIPLAMVPFVISGYVFRRNIRYFYMTMRNSMMLSLINKDEVIDENTIFHYDVFVSYCNDDRAWVLDHLLPHVEIDCSINVCLHERDFTVGLSILENIVSCMDRSKSIMLIISKQFLLSQWCQFEMHLAQHRLLETRREDLILVLLEDIPRRLRPNTLHYLMLTNTYIVWPKEKSDQDIFWKRLKKSLVTNKMKHVENNVSLA